LFLADTFDPGWSATVDGRPAPVRPAYAAFRAVALRAGRHTVVFTYVPEGFSVGLAITLASLALGVALIFWPRRVVGRAPEHAAVNWPRLWPAWLLAVAMVVVLGSAWTISPSGRPQLHPRWSNGFHRFTWGAGIEAIKPRRAKAPGRTSAAPVP